MRTLLFACLAALVLGCSPRTGSTPPAASGSGPAPTSQRSLEEAAASAGEFMQLVDSDATPARRSKRPDEATGGVYEFEYPGDRVVGVNPHDGKVVRYWDNARLGFGSTPPEVLRSCFSSREEALARLQSIAAALGAPVDAKLAQAFIELGTSGKPDYRVVSGEFTWGVDGLPVFGGFCGMKLSLDPELGRLIGFERNDDFLIEPSQERISAQEAKRIAVREVEKLDGVKHGSASDAELGYVLPRGHRDGYPRQVRLGWRVSTSGITYEVAVDAETGAVVGTLDSWTRDFGG